MSSVTKIAPFQRLGPDLETRWGTYTSPYVVSSYVPFPRDRMAPLITRTRHDTRRVPYNLTTSGPTPLGADTPSSSKTPVFVFVGLVAGAYLLWAASQPKRRGA